ncbi:MAG: PEGA domain-containing protein [Patescibacteria group bacterium]|nr:PEGA domain-containing protein [Patescibacteria group bacterium]
MIKWDIKKIILLILAFLLLSAAIFFSFFYKGTLTVNPEPNNAQVDISGIISQGPTTLKLKPGTYSLTVSAPGYISYKNEVNIKISQTLTANPQLLLSPVATKLTKNKIDFLTLGEDKQSFVYLSNSGKTFYQISKLDQIDPEITAITPDVFSNISDVVFSPNRQLFIYKKDAQTFLYDLKRYDLIHQEIHPWGEGIGDVVWSPDGNNVYYYFAPAGGETTLIKASRDNTKMERVYNFKDSPIRNPKLRISLDGKQLIVLTDKINLFDTYTQTLKELPDISQISDANFSPDSQKIAYEINGGLFLTDLEAKNRQDLGIKTALTKTTWLDNDNLIYAQNSGTASDVFYIYNVKTKKSKQYIYSSDAKISAINLNVSNDKKRLFFESNNGLYFINLEEKTS